MKNVKARFDFQIENAKWTKKYFYWKLYLNFHLKFPIITNQKPSPTYVTRSILLKTN